MAGLVPAIHVFLAAAQTWMPGTRPGMTQHTLVGRWLGRGLDHFRSEGAKLVPPPKTKDAYEDEAYRLWAIKQQRG